MKKKVIRIVAAAALFATGLLWPAGEAGATGTAGIIKIIILLAAYLLIGFDVLFKSVKSIRHGQVFNEFFLMSIATLGAIFLQEYAEAAAVMLFYQVGELFQDFAVGRSRRSIQGLVELAPDEANLLTETGLQVVSPEDIAIGDRILVRPGERVPLDGTVLTGRSRLDTSALTGESVSRAAGPGDVVPSGVINLEQPLELEVNCLFEDSSVARILSLVEDATEHKSEAERFITRFARYYTPAVVFLTLIFAIVPPFFSSLPFSEWLRRALTFLVVSCPCALVISVPLSFFGGLGGCSRAGVLVKGGNYLELLANVKTVVMDKTGTLTEGVFAVQAVLPAAAEKSAGPGGETAGFSETEILRLAAAAEQYSNHPIAAAIVAAGQKMLGEEQLPQTENMVETAGNGVQAEVEGRLVVAGNHRWLSELEIKKLPPAGGAQNFSGTVIWLAVDGVFAGSIRIADRLKADAKTAVRGLHDLGVTNTVMLTGDRAEAALPVARDLGIDQVQADLLPEDKAEVVKAILTERDGRLGADSQKERLAFVGDGINDAPVLALADVGIAMGGLGQDAAIEAADIVIMDDRPSRLLTAIKIARRTLRIARQNTVFALAVKLAVLVLSALGLTGMWLAVFADVGVSVLAILNSMRSLQVKKQAALPTGPAANLVAPLEAEA